MTETPQQERVNTAHLRDYTELRRSRTDKKLAGVAGGLGQHLNIDPTILRVAFVVLAFFGGAGLLLYGVLWLVVPVEGSNHAVVTTSASTRNAVLIVAAAVAALLLLGDGWGVMHFPWPLAILALVLFLVLMNREKPVTHTYNPPPPGEPGAGGAPPVDPEQVPPTQPAAPASGGPADEPTAGPDEATQSFTSPYYGTVPPTPAPYQVQQPPAPRPDRGPKLFWFTVALLAVALGALGTYDVLHGGVVDSAYPALALTIIGVMLLVGAWFGRPGGLIALGVVATIALIGTSATHPRFANERRVTETPTRAVQVDSRYAIPAGVINLDMSNIHDVQRLDGRTVAVDANAGQIVVTLPQGVDAKVNADVSGAGQVTVLGEQRSGVGGVSIDRSVDAGPDAPVMNLNLDLTVGSIEVRQ